MRLIGRLLVGLLATLGLLVVLLVVGAVVGYHALRPEVASLPGRFVLTADWREPIAEAESPISLTELSWRPRPTVTDLVLALDRAVRDPRVAALVVEVDDTSHGFAVAQELRDAVARLRAAGKPTLVHADSFGELSPGNEGYYLASAFDEIHLQPVGILGLTGLMFELPSFGNLLASLGISLEVVRRAEYKTALEPFTERDLTPANREMMTALLGELSRQFVAGIAQGRRLDEAEASRLVANGPYTADEAVAAGLVDRLAYAEDTLKAAEDMAGTSDATIDLDDYVDATADEESGGGGKVALIRAAGLIQRGSGVGSQIQADDLTELLEDAAADDEVRAVLLRLDSPGGSAVASETVAHAIRRLTGQGKPVVVSMGNVAASGGYWIAMHASRILAQPATLTGSIGVVAGKPNLADAWTKLGVTWAPLAAAPNAEIWSPNRPYGDAAQARVDAIVGDLYASFTKGVAEGRKLAPQRVDEIARGRVWAGSTARDLGLVDELGGIVQGLAAIRTALGLTADAALAIEVWPPREGPFGQLMDLVEWDDGGVLSGVATLIQLWLQPPTAALPLPLRAR